MIGLILPTHTYDPSRLIASVLECDENVRWYIYHHSDNRNLENKLKDFSQKSDARLHLYRVNRGLAKSWNEGIHSSLEDECELTIILNDDLHFKAGGFRNFIDHLRENSTFDLGFLNGLEIGGHLDGQTIVQGMACFAIARKCIERVGYFDEAFVPAYYEDIDYLMRMRLAGASQTIAPGVIAEHLRSSTTRCNPDLAKQLAAFHQRNREYYERKWGGEEGKEVYQTPFGREDFGLRIDWDNRHAPYGRDYLPA